MLCSAWLCSLCMLCIVGCMAVGMVSLWGVGFVAVVTTSLLCGKRLGFRVWFFHISDKDFVCWCRQTAHMRIAAALLESYERQVQSVEGALKVATLLSPSLFSLVTLLSPFCHPLVILLSPSCHPLVILWSTSFTLLSPSCHPLVTLLSPSCHPLVTLLTPSCHPPVDLNISSCIPKPAFHIIITMSLYLDTDMFMCRCCLPLD